MNVLLQLNQYRFGYESISIQNDSLIHSQATLGYDAIYLKVNEVILSTFGYSPQGIEILLGRIEKCNRVTHIPVLCGEKNQEDYEPFIIFDYDVRQNKLSEQLLPLFNELLNTSKDHPQFVHCFFLSFFKDYFVTIAQEDKNYNFVAHASPIVFAKSSEKYCLFAFDRTIQQLCNNELLINFFRQHSISVFTLKEPLLYSESNCCAFSFDIINKCLNNFDLIDFTVKKNLSSDLFISIPLDPDHFPLSLMECCESVSRKVSYLSAMDHADLCGKEILMRTICRGILIKANRRGNIMEEEKDVSKYLYQLNMRQVSLLNSNNEEFHSLLNKEVNALKLDAQAIGNKG